MPDDIQITIKCPNCEEESGEINYNASNRGYENGTAYIIRTNNNRPYLDYNCQDTSIEETDEFNYTCPDCDYEYDNFEEILENSTYQRNPTTPNGQIENNNNLNAPSKITKYLNNTKNINIKTSENNISYCKKCKTAFLTSDEDEKGVNCPNCESFFIPIKNK